MSCRDLLALMLVGTVALFLFGGAAPSPFLHPELVVPPVSPPQAHERETAVAALPHCPVDQEQAHNRAGNFGELPRPSCKVEEPAQPDRCVASCPEVAAWTTPPANPRCEAPEPRCETPLPCREQTSTHTMTISNGARVERQKFVERDGSWQSCGELHNPVAAPQVRFPAQAVPQQPPMPLDPVAFQQMVLQNQEMVRQRMMQTQQEVMQRQQEILRQHQQQIMGLRR
jgi:hypothetical protein